MEPIVSVIVPVYNAEDRLAVCIDSILTQSFADFEVLLVNDGSKDGSLNICKAYAARDERIILLDKKNGGVAAARNDALRRARGKYIQFVDADDAMEAGAMGKMVQAAEKYNVKLIIAHYFFEMGTSSKNCGLLTENRFMDQKTFMENLIVQPGSFYYSALWNKLYRADIIRNENLFFDPTLNWGEDFAFNMNYNRYADRIYIMNDAVYHYQKSIKGLTFSTLRDVPHNIHVKWRMYQYLKRLCVETGVYNNHKAMIHRYVFNITLME